MFAVTEGALGGPAQNSVTTNAAGNISGLPLAPGASINLNFLLGVQTPGSFRFFITVEALPGSPSSPFASAGQSAPTNLDNPKGSASPSANSGAGKGAHAGGKRLPK